MEDDSAWLLRITPSTPLNYQKTGLRPVARIEKIGLREPIQIPSA